MKTVQILSTLTILVLVSSCGTGTRFPTSDVPCFEPSAWAKSSQRMFIRAENGNPNVLLFMHQSFEQRDIDLLDGQADFKPRDPIYRFDRNTNIFDIVDDSVWENNNSEITNCLRGSSNFGPFTVGVNPDNRSESFLQYNEQQVSVEGGTFMRLFSATFFEDLDTQAVAVLSTDGIKGRTFILLPSQQATGQHFHQLFSEVDGQPLGPALRIGIGGLDKWSLEVCWAVDNKYVIYGEADNGSEGYNNICVVDVEDEIQSVSGN